MEPGRETAELGADGCEALETTDAAIRGWVEIASGRQGGSNGAAPPAENETTAVEEVEGGTPDAGMVVTRGDNPAEAGVGATPNDRAAANGVRVAGGTSAAGIEGI